MTKMHENSLLKNCDKVSTEISYYISSKNSPAKKYNHEKKPIVKHRVFLLLSIYL